MPVFKPTRQLKRLAKRKGLDLVQVEPEPMKLKAFHAGCGTSLIPRGEEIVCPRCNCIITQDAEIEMLPVD